MLFEVKNVSFGYSPRELMLENVSLSVDEGERVGLVGPSDYGKNTLSKLLAGYPVPTEDEILFEKRPLPTTGYCSIQFIYQYPKKVVNTWRKVCRILEESWAPDGAFL